MKPFDVIIIGGGVIGASIARELSRYRLGIALLEKGEELAFGVSKSNSGIIHPGTQNPPMSLKGRLCVSGNRLTRKVARELGVDLKEVGELIVAFDVDEAAKLIQLKAEAESLGVPGLRIVDKAWLRAREPNLSGQAIAALYAPTAAVLSPYRMAYDLSENAVKNGVEIYTKNEVERIERRPDERYRFCVAAGGAAYKARYIINAAGLFADDISRMVGVSDFTITPRKGEEFLLDKKKEGMTNHLIFPLPSRVSKGILIIKTSDGNPMIGPTALDVPEKDDLTTTDEGLQKVLASARKMVPSISGDDVIAYFAGLRPVAGSDFIIRHEDDVPGFVNVAGMQSPGLTAAPAVAQMVAGILKAKGLRLRRKIFFRAHRKKTIHLFTLGPKKAKALIKKDGEYGDIVCRCEMVSAKEVKEAIKRGASTLDGIKFRTRAQAGRCHGSFCTNRLIKTLSKETGRPVTEVTKRGAGSEIIKGKRGDG